MKVLNFFFVLIVLTFFSVSAFPETWQTYQNMNAVLDLAIDDDDIWMTMESGGVLKWQKLSGMYTHYNRANVLTDNDTNRIFKDSNGRIWAPNGDGVSCYEDGNWRYYGAEDGLSVESVTSIAEDKTGTLWFSTANEGVWSFDGVAWERYWKDKWIFTTNINVILPVSNGEVLFGRNGGIVRFDGSDWSIFASSDSKLPHPYIYSLLKTEEGTIYAGSFANLSLYDGETWKTIEGIGNSVQVNAMAVDETGILWLATDEQIKKVEDGNITGFENHPFTSVVIDKQGIKWFGSRWHGVLRLDGDNKTWYRQSDGLAGDSVNALTVDHHGAVWAATTYGISRFTDGAWEKISSISATAIIEDADGNIWIGTGNDGLYTYSPSDGSWKNYNEAGPFDLNEIRCLAVDDAGALWVGASGYIARYDGESWQLFSPLNNISHDACNQIIVDNDNRKWFLFTEWIQSFDDQFWKGHGGSTFSRASSIGVDSNGLLWITARNRLYTFDENAPEHSMIVQYPSSSLPSDVNSFLDIVIDPHDVKWFTTQNNGINRLDGEQWTHFTTTDGLPDSLITRIVLDDNGAIWASSYQGIAVFENGAWDSFTISANCPEDNCVLSSDVDSENNAWFGTGRGVSCYSRGTWTNFSSDDGLPVGRTTSIVTGADGTIWAGHQGYSSDSEHFYGGGVSRYVAGEWITTHKNSNIDAIALDRTGTVWMAYSGWGAPYPTQIVYYINDQWHEVPFPEELTEYRCFSIAIDRDNVKWFGFISIYPPVRGVIASYDGLKVQIYSNPDLRYLLTRGAADSLWFISANGTMLTRYNGKNWETFTPPYIFGENGQLGAYTFAGMEGSVYKQFITAKTDSKGTTLFSTQSGLVRFDGASWKIYANANDLTLEHAINTITIDKNDIVWVGTKKGMANLSESTGVEDKQTTPVEITVCNVPNPFNMSTVISYTVPTSGRVSLSLYDITGRKVRELADGAMTAGAHHVVWDGTDQNGIAVASGIYFIRVVCGNRVANGKMLLVK